MNYNVIKRVDEPFYTNITVDVQYKEPTLGPKKVIFTTKHQIVATKAPVLADKVIKENITGTSTVFTALSWSVNGSDQG